MNSDANIVQLIYRCIDQINEQLPVEERIEKVETTILVGEGSVLESLTMVTLLVEIEEAAFAKGYGRVDILSEGVTAPSGPAFGTVAELAEWIKSKQIQNV